MFSIFKQKKIDNPKIVAPVDGRCVSLDCVPDPMFSGKLLGDGVAFQYEGSELYSPCDGEVVVVANSKHAIGIRNIEGIELLLHIGVNTVDLQGKGFEVLVKQGQIVSLGQPLWKLDRTFFNQQKIDLITAMVVTNGVKYSLSYGKVNQNVKQGISEIVWQTKGEEQ